MEVISKEVFIVTNLGCVPSQHLFLKQVEFKEPWRRKAEEETHQSHLAALEMASWPTAGKEAAERGL